MNACTCFLLFKFVFFGENNVNKTGCVFESSDRMKFMYLNVLTELKLMYLTILRLCTASKE